MPLNAAPPFTLGMAIPANQSLVGFTFHLQWCTLTMNSVNGVPTTSSIVSSNAGTAVIGN